jgi:hypothetical protein
MSIMCVRQQNVTVPATQAYYVYLLKTVRVSHYLVLWFYICDAFNAYGTWTSGFLVSWPSQILEKSKNWVLHAEV